MENFFDRPIIPPDEEQRLRALRYFDVINELPDEYFTALARTVAHAFGAPVGLISLVSEEEVFFRGNYGMEEVSRVERGKSLCSLAILDKNITVFEDAVKDPCLLRNPLVHGEFGLRFYAGAPIITRDGYCIGTVCVVDKAPREFDAQERALLRRFSELVMENLYTNHCIAGPEQEAAE